MLTVLLLTCSLVELNYVYSLQYGAHHHLISNNFQIVLPKVFGSDKRYRRDHVPKKRFEDHLTIEFHGFDRSFKIKLQKNNVLLPTSFKTFVMKPDGSIESNHQVKNCYYHGHLEDKDSSVVLQTCNGIKGYIHDHEDDSSFIIQPSAFQNSSIADHILYKTDKLNNANHGKCGYAHVYDDQTALPTSKKAPPRLKRAITEEKYIELVAVTGAQHVKKYGVTGSMNRAVEIMNYVDAVYKTVSTRVALIGVITFENKNQFSISSSAEKTLSEFQKFVSGKIHGEKLFGDLDPDNSQLISDVAFASSQVGLAAVGDICSFTSAAVNKDHGTEVITANTVSHELGHNLGFFHNAAGCTCANEPCVMSGTVPSTKVRGFTDCAQNKWQQILSSGDASCVFNYPEKLHGKPKCGNGYKETGEECDCGTEKECEMNGGAKCCNATTCQLKAHAHCATGPCCSNCQFKKQGELCRGKLNNECDLEEYCVGDSSECPKNFFIQDGVECDRGNAYCYQGACKNYTIQCKTLWGENAVKAHDACFANNKRGDEYGNCGETDQLNKYKKCEESNKVCGKLQCSGKSETHPLPEFPIIGSYRGRKEVYFKAGSNTIKCVMGKTSLGRDMFDPTMAFQGTKCGENKICVENRCTNISSLTSIKKCKLACKNGGVCNNNGNCHCPVGFACPYCESKGPGGSIDSGQGCGNNTLPTAITTIKTKVTTVKTELTAGKTDQVSTGKIGTTTARTETTETKNETSEGTKGKSKCGEEGLDVCASPSKMGVLVLLLLLVPLAMLKIYCSCCQGNPTNSFQNRYQILRKSTSRRCGSRASFTQKEVPVTDIDSSLVCFYKFNPQKKSSKSRPGFFPLFPDISYDVTDVSTSQPVENTFYSSSSRPITTKTKSDRD